MNDVNVLFVISCIFAPLMLISINYSTISDFYEYSVPLNTLIIDRDNFSDDPDIFQKTIQKEDSTCYTNPNGNLFCYEKPRIDDNGHGISYVRGENGIQGELHFDPVDKGVSYFTMKNMTNTNDEKSILTLADYDYSSHDIDGNIHYVNEFEYSIPIEKFDTFISHCRNNDGTLVNLIQYLGIEIIGDENYFLTWHTIAYSETGIKCTYPEIIQHSLNYDFGI